MSKASLRLGFVSFFINLVTILCSSYEVDVLKQFGTENWTNCEDFLANTTFSVSDVVDVDWKIFYFWNQAEENSYNIRFSLATPILVDRFKVELDKMNTTVDWSKAVLFMETSIDLSALYITTETPGVFRLIPSFAFHMDTIPLLIFGLKIVEPGYLGIMNCQYRFCYALAPVDRMPEGEDIKLAAEKIGFRGDYNRSYLFRNDPPPGSAPDFNDSVEDEAVDIENEMELDDDIR